MKETSPSVVTVSAGIAVMYFTAHSVCELLPFAQLFSLFSGMYMCILLRIMSLCISVPSFNDLKHTYFNLLL